MPRRDGRRLRADPFDLGWERYERDGAVLPDEDLEAIRKLDAVLLGAVGAAPGPGRGDRRARHPAPAALRARPLREPPPVRRRARRAPSRHRPRRHPREHRRRLRGRGRVPAEGHAARGRHPGIGEHPDGCRAVHPLRVRAGAVASAQAPHARAQDQRAHVRGRPLAAHVRRGRARVSRRRPPRTTTSTPRASTSCRIRAATT